MQNLVGSYLKNVTYKTAIKCTGITWGGYVVGSYLIAILLEKSQEYNSFTTSEYILRNSDLTNKIAIVTGASGAIGKGTTKILVKKGCKVYMACRDIVKAGNTKQQIIDELKKEDITDISHLMVLIKLDLSSLQSCYEFAKIIVSNNIKVNYLINNAGIMGLPKYKETIDGYEMQFATNHLGHFYITILMLPIIKQNKTRIINVSSFGHTFCEYNKTKELIDDSIKNKCYFDNKKYKYHPMTNYGISKACNILFSPHQRGQLPYLPKKCLKYQLAV